MNKRKIYLISFLISSIVLSLGLISGIPGVVGNSLIISVGILLFPYFFFRYQEFVRIKEMEEKFPIFLRDLVESIRSGVPLSRAIIDSSRINYGKHLTREIKRIANQLTWRMPVNKVIDLFIKRLKKSRRLQSALRIVKEAYFSGGDLASTIDAVADSTTLLIDCEKERRSVLNNYVVGIYAISIIFLGVIVTINNFLLPIFAETEEYGGIGIEDPCKISRDVASQLICDFYEIIGKNVLRVESSYYLSFFFLMALIQAFFAGLVIGQISERSFIAGIKHSVILVGIVWGTFLILIQIGILG